MEGSKPKKLKVEQPLTAMVAFVPPVRLPAPAIVDPVARVQEEIVADKAPKEEPEKETEEITGDYFDWYTKKVIEGL